MTFIFANTNELTNSPAQKASSDARTIRHVWPKIRFTAICCSGDIVLAGGRLVTTKTSPRRMPNRETRPDHLTRAGIAVNLGQNVAKEIAEREEKNARAVDVLTYDRQVNRETLWTPIRFEQSRTVQMPPLSGRNSDIAEVRSSGVDCNKKMEAYPVSGSFHASDETLVCSDGTRRVRLRVWSDATCNGQPYFLNYALVHCLVDKRHGRVEQFLAARFIMGRQGRSAAF